LLGIACEWYDRVARGFSALNKQQFLQEFAEILGVSPSEISSESELSSLENWDSVAYLSTMILLDEKLGIAISPDQLTTAKTIQDIMNVAEPALQNS
jgi:acyl carrier protein